jgi:hypothetical protein
MINFKNATEKRRIDQKIVLTVYMASDKMPRSFAGKKLNIIGIPSA